MKNFSILLIFSSFILLSNTCDVFVETYSDLPEEDKALLNSFREGDTIKLMSTKSSKVIELVVSEKQDFYYAVEDVGLGQQIEFEKGSVNFEQKSKYAGLINIAATRDSQTCYRLRMSFDNVKFYRGIYSIDDSINYTKNQVLVEGIYTYSDVYVFNDTTCDTCTSANKIYLNAEHGILKIENLETGNAYTLVR